MKNRKLCMGIGIAIPIVCCLIILYLLFVKTDTIRFTWMPVPDAQEQIDIFAEIGYCNGGFVSDDKSYVEIKLTERQRRKWLRDMYEEVADFVERANEISHMRIEVSSDTKKLTVYADREVSFQNLATYLGIITWDIETIQVLNGEADWEFEFTVKDMKTEKVLYTALCPPGRVKVYESMWDVIEDDE